MSHVRETGSPPIAAGNPVCSICGTRNTCDAGFCRCCGVSITRASEHLALLENSGFCETCQSAHATPARFCDQCGGKLPGYVRPPDISSQTVRGVAGIMPVSENSKTGGTFGPLAKAEERRLSATHYLIMPALFAATVAGMYFSGYRITQADAGVSAALQADAGGSAALQAAVSVPAAVLHPVAVPLPAGPIDAVKNLVSFDAAPIEPAQAEPVTGNGAQVDLPVLPTPTADKSSGRPLRLALQRVIAEEAYEEPVSPIRELPAMPIHDFKSLVQLDAARN